MTSLAAKYDIYSPLPSTPDFEIKLHVWTDACTTVSFAVRFALLFLIFVYFIFLASCVFLLSL